MINKYRYLLVILAVLFTQVSKAQTFDQFETVPGGVAVVRINAAEKPEAYFQDKRVIVLGQPGSWNAVVGLPCHVNST